MPTTTRRRRRKAASRRQPARTRRRRRTNRSQPNNSSVTIVPPALAPTISALRSFNFHAPKLENTTVKPVPKPSWIDSITSVGGVVMKLISAVVGVAGTNEAKYLPTGITQTILIGAEDLLYSTAIVEYSDVQEGKVTENIPYIAFKNAKLSNFRIEVKNVATTAKQAGRYAVLLQELTAEDVADYAAGDRSDFNKRVWDRNRPGVPFDELIKMPGARVARVMDPIVIGWSPRPGSPLADFIGIGITDIPAGLSNPPGGGDPLLAITIAYQDLSSTDVAPADLYGAEEIMLSVNISASIQLRDIGARYIRWTPPIVADAQKVGVTNRHGRYIGDYVGESEGFETLDALSLE